MWRLRQPSYPQDPDAWTPQSNSLPSDSCEDHWEDASVSIMQPWSLHAQDDDFQLDRFEQRREVSAAGGVHPSPPQPLEEASAQNRRCSTFPPPIATCAILSYKERGRLVLKEVSALPRTQGFLRAERQDGCLRLQLIEPSAIKDEDGSDVESEYIDVGDSEDIDVEGDPPSPRVENQEGAAVCSREDACIEKLDSPGDDEIQMVSDFEEWCEDYESDGEEDNACSSSYESECFASPKPESSGAVRDCRCPAIANCGSHDAGDLDEHGVLSMDTGEKDIPGAHDSAAKLLSIPNIARWCRRSLLLPMSMGSTSAKYTCSRDNEDSFSSHLSTSVETGSGKTLNAVIGGSLANMTAMDELICSSSLPSSPSSSSLLSRLSRSMTQPPLPLLSSLLSPSDNKCEAETMKALTEYCEEGKNRTLYQIPGRSEAVLLGGGGGGCRDHLAFGAGMGGWTISNGRSRSSVGSSKLWSSPPQLLRHPSLVLTSHSLGSAIC